MGKIVDFDSNTVIDMGVISKLADAINKQDDVLSALTTNLSLGVSSNVSGTTQQYVFDLARTTIMFGRYPVAISTGEALGQSVLYYTSFKSPPIVVATASFDTQSSFILATTVSNVSTDKFDVSIKNVLDTSTAYGNVYVNWIAIGEKV